MLSRELSHREAQVAALTVEGFAQAEISARLSLQTSTVVTYRKRAYQKLGVSGRRHLRERLAEIEAGALI